jgi:adenine specific DNA methylase Mod
VNRLFYRDNLPVLRESIASESVDRLYLDPPFKSNQDYNVLFGDRHGTRAAAQIEAFENTWQWDNAAARARTKRSWRPAARCRCSYEAPHVPRHERHAGVHRDDGAAAA